MKKIITLFILLGLVISANSQAPQKMSYQAVIRNASNQLVMNTQVGIRMSILQWSANGTAVYVETQTPTTNDNGLITFEIGTGTTVSGSFAGIDWAKGIYFIKTETDITGGVNYTITATSQLLSVPYALFSATSGSATDAVKTSGDQTIAGTKTFTETVNVNTPVNSMEAVNKAYVDNKTRINISSTGDTLFIGDKFIIINGLSSTNQGTGTITPIPDITWSVITTDNNDFRHISFGNNVFIAVTDNGCTSTNNSAYVSTDYGLTWVKKATPGSTDMSGIAYSPINKIFVASHRCYENDRSYSYTTDNGNTWTPILQSPATYRYDIYRIKDYFFSCIVYNSVDKSTDGINWSHLSFGGSIPYSVSAYSDKFGLYYANSYPWYAGNTDKFYTSPDATNWTARDTLAKYQFVAGNDVVLSYLTTSPKPYLRRSVDGINFSLINSLPNINSIAHMTFMNGLFWATIDVTGVNTQKVMVSYDGTSWKVLNTPAVDTYASGIAIGFDPAINKNVIIISCLKGMFLRGVIND